MATVIPLLEHIATALAKADGKETKLAYLPEKDIANYMEKAKTCLKTIVTVPGAMIVKSKVWSSRDGTSHMRVDVAVEPYIPEWLLIPSFVMIEEEKKKG